MDYTITFACLNQVYYTRKLIQSLVEGGYDLSRVVVVDNASTDETDNLLTSLPLGSHIRNRVNLGCGIAWNQGILARQSEWTVVMNNDVVVSPGWIESMISFAKSSNIDVVSPAMIEGSDDYDVLENLKSNAFTMQNACRYDDQHLVCLLLRSSVWQKVGLFRSSPGLFGYEDSIFFSDLRRAGVRTAITGSSWIHHYGSITQNYLRKELGLAPKTGLGNRKNYKLLNESLFSRKLRKLKTNFYRKYRQEDEIKRYGKSLHGIKISGKAINWRVL